jgi:hypothetical protein
MPPTTAPRPQHTSPGHPALNRDLLGRFAWTLVLECFFLVPMLVAGVRPPVVVISAIAACVLANLVWDVLTRGSERKEDSSLTKQG